MASFTGYIKFSKSLELKKQNSEEGGNQVKDPNERDVSLLIYIYIYILILVRRTAI